MPFIKLTVDGFELCGHQETPTLVKWSEVETVIAFKTDEFTTDRIWFRVYWGSPQFYIDVHEEIAGFSELDSAMASHLSGFDTRWWDKVAKPAFKPNETILFSRSESGKQGLPPQNDSGN